MTESEIYVRALRTPRTEGRPCRPRPSWFRFREDGWSASCVAAKHQKKNCYKDPKLILPAHHSFASLHSLLLRIRVSGSWWSSSTWAFTVCLYVCSSWIFLGPWGAGSWDQDGCLSFFMFLDPLAEASAWDLGVIRFSCFWLLLPSWG